MTDEYNEYDTYENDFPTDEMLQNWNEANDYVNEGEDEDLTPDDELSQVEDLDDLDEGE